MVESIRIMFSHNNPDNGEYTGKCRHIEFGSDMELELYSEESITTRIEQNNKRVKISRRYFPITAYQTWVGNWCWDAVWVNENIFNQIWDYLKDLNKFKAEGGVSKYYNLWCDLPF